MPRKEKDRYGALPSSSSLWLKSYPITVHSYFYQMIASHKETFSSRQTWWLQATERHFLLIRNRRNSWHMRSFYFTPLTSIGNNNGSKLPNSIFVKSSSGTRPMIANILKFFRPTNERLTVSHSCWIWMIFIWSHNLFQAFDDIQRSLKKTNS